MRSEGHTQFKGKRYCPHERGVLLVKELLQLRRAEAAARAIEKDKDRKKQSLTLLSTYAQ